MKIVEYETVSGHGQVDCPDDWDKLTLQEQNDYVLNSQSTEEIETIGEMQYIII